MGLELHLRLLSSSLHPDVLGKLPWSCIIRQEIKTPEHLGTVVHTFNPNTSEAEAEGLLQVPGQPNLHRKTSILTNKTSKTPGLAYL